MSRTRTFVSLAVITATSFALAACGGDDDSSDSSADSETSSSEPSALAAPLIEGLAAEFAADPEMGLDATQSECFATEFVNAIGVEELIAAGLTADTAGLSDEEALAAMDLNEDQANGLADLMLGGQCFSFVDMMLADPEASDDLTTEQTTCIANELTQSETFRTATVAELMGTEIDEATGMAMFGELLMMMGTCGIDMDM